MQKALPYRDWLSSAAESGPASLPPEKTESGGAGTVEKLVAENAVVVLARRGCYMCHVVKLLLNGHGVNPSVFDVDEENEADVNGEVARITGSAAAPQLPAVFVGGELVGGLEDIMGAHISGELLPRLRKARALWL